MSVLHAPALRALTLAAALLPALLNAAPKDTLDLLFATQQYPETALSPDDRRLAWVEARPNADRTPSDNSVILVLDEPNATPRRVTAGDGTKLHGEHGLAWSPDGAQLAFLSDQEKSPQLQLYVVPKAGGPPRQLTHLTGYLNQAKWSPDGKTIALLQIADSLARAGAVEAAPRESGEIAERIAEQRLTLVDVATGAARTVTAADSYVYEFDWSPDSRQIVFTSAKGSGDNNWWIARLYALDIASTAVRELYKPVTQLAVPRWSPDGRQIAFIQGLMSDAGSTGGDIWVVPAAGGAARDLTPDRPGSPAWLQWLPAGQLLFSEWKQGGSAIARLDPATGRTDEVWHGDETFDADGEVLSLSVAGGGASSALVRSSWSHPPEVWAGRLGAWQQVTHANQDRLPHWGRFESVSWSNDGHAVQGWLLYPQTFDPKKHYPLIVSVHGGPASQLTPRWPRAGFNLAIMAAEDYFVFFPNPRGSYGQGETFTAANVRDFGGGDLRDILTGLDAVLKKVPVDEQRLGLGGWSYGGYLTMWALTQTNRFRAAVTGAGIANWQSYYGENLIDQWMIPYFGASVYDDPAAYAQSSPMTFIKNVRTPTLIAVGDSDKECPAPQSYEYWHALRTQGVKTSFVVYENEGHWFHDPAHTADLLNRTVNWFDDHLRH
jgi:dipeptidyl aminopeptidase/acylaminoacyl peptidase